MPKASRDRSLGTLGTTNMLHKIRFLALLAGLAADILGTLIFSTALGIVAAIVAVRVGMPLKLFYEKTTTDVAFLLVQYMIGLVFTFAGAFLTAKLSQPHSLFNTVLFGLITTLAGLLFVSMLPAWYTALCMLTIIPVSLIPGYMFSPKKEKA